MLAPPTLASAKAQLGRLLGQLIAPLSLPIGLAWGALEVPSNLAFCDTSEIHK